MKYENIFILIAQNVSQAMSKSYVIITKCFRLRTTANFFPNAVNNKEFNVIYSSLNTSYSGDQIKNNEMDGVYSTYG
jgi:hypothetical protein